LKPSPKPIERLPKLGTWILWHCRLDDGFYRFSNTGRLRRRRRRQVLHAPEKARLEDRKAWQEIPISVSDVEFNSVRATKGIRCCCFGPSLSI
jgi:hypothetical protein